MSFFIKSKPSFDSSKLSSNKRKRRKPENNITSKDEDDDTEDEDNILFEDGNQSLQELSDEDLNETPQDKKLRLAKIYLKEIEREEIQRTQEKELSLDVVSQRIKDDHLKSIGKYEYKIADKYTKVNENNIIILKCKQQRDTITCLCVSSDDKWIFSGSKNGVVVKWSLSDRKKIGVIPFTANNDGQVLGHSFSVLCICISTDNSFLVVGDKSGAIQVWNPLTLQHIQTLTGHKKAVTGVIFKQNTHMLYSVSEDRSVRIWSLDEMAFVESLFGHQDSITAIDILHADKPITAGGCDGTLRLWKIREESQLIFNAAPGNIDTVKMINDQNFITGGDDGQICVWSIIKKKPLCTIKEAHGCDTSSTSCPPNWISSVTSLVHSDLAASGSQDGFIRLWKLGDKFRSISKICEIPVQGFINALSFTSDGKYLIAGCGRAHRLGRWNMNKSAVNAIYLIPLQNDE